MDLFDHILHEHLATAAELSQLKLKLIECAEQITASLAADGKLMLFGNGGSAADAQHIAAEFVGRFEVERPALTAIALTTDTSLLTAVSNDYGYDAVFSRQVDALARPNDVVLGISTSGNSRNVLLGLQRARSLGCVTWGFSGRGGGRMNEYLGDNNLVVPSANTARTQECHILLGHMLCALIDEKLTGYEG